MKTKIHFKSIVTVLILLMVGQLSQAQRFDLIDASPHDIAYFQPAQNSGAKIRVVYGRPGAEDERVFGTQVPFDQIWATGSNESTEIEFYSDVMFGNKFIKAGKYVLYSIPGEKYWTVILNKKTDTYGAHFYNPNFDVARIEVPVHRGEMLEHFSIAFDQKKFGAQMIMGWAQTRVKVPLYTEENLISKI